MRKQVLHPRTEALNKVQKNHSKKNRNDALVWLMATFPKAFDNTLRIQPLKIGIMSDILAYADQAAEFGLSKSKLREAVVLFTRRIDYLTCLKAREMRIDLRGEITTSVTAEEAEKASAKIRKRIEKSARNAKKPSLNSIHSGSSHYASPYESAPNASERAPAFNAQNTTQSVQKTTPVVVHKTTRSFDPEAVARLKEKLGLSRKTESEQEK